MKVEATVNAKKKTNHQCPALKPASSGKHKPTTHKPSFAGVPLNSEDLTALDDFCESFQVPDISLKEFSSAHSNIHLMIPLVLTEKERTEGGSKVITFTRTKRIFDQNNKAQVSKHQVSYKVSWPPGISWSDKITLPKMGDQAINGKIGHVYFLIKPHKT
ncbi:MAG: hypothetical protein OXC40_05690 [Proteobacteria bacterium]|nr:hypothetical protein [Pseudomonadota bacterium]